LRSDDAAGPRPSGWQRHADILSSGRRPPATGNHERHETSGDQHACETERAERVGAGPLPQPGGGTITLGAKPVKGIVSPGMLCAEDELGLGDSGPGLLATCLGAGALMCAAGAPGVHWAT